MLVMAGRTYRSKSAVTAGHREIYNKPMEDLFFGSRTPKACIYGLHASFWVRYVNVGKLEKIPLATSFSMLHSFVREKIAGRIKFAGRS